MDLLQILNEVNQKNIHVGFSPSPDIDVSFLCFLIPVFAELGFVSVNGNPLPTSGGGRKTAAVADKLQEEAGGRLKISSR